ncbi:MAG TPA: organomercurial lyase [Roseiflexaceae bacterium]|nr:organomercurial lyase [Roseiflexaceae bacterium]
MSDSEELIWTARSFVYAHFVATAQPPTIDQTAQHLAITPEAAVGLYRTLDARHALRLEPGTTQIRMTNPFSTLPTSFEVTAHGQCYWANCAWDAFGIPAALHADADIRARCAFSGTPLHIRVRGATFSGDHGFVHFLLPCHRWYDDLVFT